MTLNTAIQPVADFYIRDVETMKVLVSPLRTQILSILVSGVHTVKQVSQKLNVPPNRLYYHFNQLEQYRLIEVVETRVISGILEKHYRSSAINYLVDPALLAPQAETNRQVLAGLLKEVMAAPDEEKPVFSQDGLMHLSQSLPQTDGLPVRRMVLALPADQVQVVYERIKNLIEEYVRALPGNLTQASSPAPHVVAVVLYPSTAAGTDEDRVEYSQETTVKQ